MFCFYCVKGAKKNKNKNKKPAEDGDMSVYYDTVDFVFSLKRKEGNFMAA